MHDPCLVCTGLKEEAMKHIFKQGKMNYGLKIGGYHRYFPRCDNSSVYTGDNPS